MPRIRAAFAELESALPGLLASAARDRRMDAGEGKRIRDLIDRAKTQLASTITTADIEALAERFAERTATYQRIQLNRQTKAVLGADVFINDRNLRARVEGFVSENVALIKDIPAKLASDIEGAAMRAVQGGTLHSELAKELNDRFGIAEDRAKLIARDQVGKLYGQVNADRQRALGVTSFTWRTVQDERVRSEHEARDGETYTYADPPDGELPGEPINCRCYAEPSFDDILAGL